MESLMNRRLVIAVLTIACLTTVLLIVGPTRSSGPGAGEYDAWLDVNDDGRIDMKDIGSVARAFGTSGQNVSKASLMYDSGWLDLRNETGEYYTITHNLNDTELQVDAREIIPGWNRTYGGTNRDEAYDLVQTGDGGYALVGFTNSSGAGGYDFWLIKIDAAGNAQWNKTYGGTNNDLAEALVQTTDGGYALVGYTESFGAGDADFWLIKTDAAGNVQWNRTYGGTSYDFAYALVQTADGGYALAGRTKSFGAGNYDFWLIKTDAAGNSGGFESGLAWVDPSANTITLYRGATDTNWNYVRVRIWKPR
jgi:predicted secreted protein